MAISETRDAVWAVDSDEHNESCVRSWGPEVLRDVAMATNFWLYVNNSD